MTSAHLYGGIAQLARALGSYPWCHWFKSSCRYHAHALQGGACADEHSRNVSLVSTQREAQRSGFALERRSDVASEESYLYDSET